ncbi:hypothetical protein D3C84_1063760 [compost metagenome]
MSFRLSVTSPEASSSRPRTWTSPTWRVTLFSVTELFFWVRSNTAAVSRVLVPGGWYLIPASYCSPSVGLNASVLLTVEPAAAWNDWAKEM